MDKYLNAITTPIKKSFYFGILFIFLLGFLMHHLYSLCGNSSLIAIIAPVNESVWEHLKLAVLPAIIWWSISYTVLSKKTELSFTRWFFAFVVALIVCPLIIVSVYYTYTGVFGIHSFLLDLFAYFLGVTISQLVGMHVYQYAKINSALFYLSALIFALLMMAFIIFTFNPPLLPLFWDPLTRRYGI